MREQRRDLLPAWRGLGPLQLEGRSDRLTGDGQWQRQTPRVQRGLRAGRPRLLRAGVHMVGMGAEGGDGRGHARGMHEGLQGAWWFGIDRVQSVHRRIQPEAQFDLPAHAVKVGHLPWADPGRQIRQEHTVPFGGLDSHQAQGQGVAPAADLHIGVNDPSIQAQALLLEQRIDVAPWEELLEHLPTGNIVDP
jgi:hypothetical protein